KQRSLWESEMPKIGQVTEMFFQVIRASATDPEVLLSAVVPDKQYREVFLSLSRNLAPTGKTFDRLDVRDAGAPNAVVASFEPETRQELNAALRKARPERKKPGDQEPETIRGTLRALHLDQDWLEVATAATLGEHVRIDGAGDALDDVVGPMVNRPVIVTVRRRGKKWVFQDIETEE
ncbi:MAG TPA: hypothetical protein VFV98_10970, partial [Vicinamibacterales bacterium]|nr:hypothetical protein [Vicinamibacterales bacterium]